MIGLVLGSEVFFMRSPLTAPRLRDTKRVLTAHEERDREQEKYRVENSPYTTTTLL
jgi:hypothetical protein